MREHQLLSGVKRWHGSDFLDLQYESLTPIQKFFETLGNVVITGCKIINIAGTWYITEGYIGCMHADGYKIAKFPQTSLGTGAVSYPMYLKIDKTAINKMYDDTNTKLSINNYTASMTTVIPGAGLYISILNSVGAAPTWKDALLLKESWRYIGGSGQPAFVNAFANGYAPNGVPDNLRYKKDIGGNVWLAGAIDYSPLAAGPFGGIGLQVAQAIAATHRPDRELSQNIVLALPGGTATIKLTLQTNGILWAQAVGFSGGVSDSDISSGTPFGEYFEFFYPAV